MNPLPHKQSYLEDLLLSFRRKIFESVCKDAVKFDLTFPQMEIIRYVMPLGSVTMKGIAEHLKITPPSATVMVEHMEKKGLVKRVPDQSDRRVVHIQLTPKTQKLLSVVSKHKQSIFNKMISKLSKDDQQTLERIVRVLIKD